MANTRSGGGAAGSGARREGHTTVPSTAAAAASSSSPTKPPNARETRSTTGAAAAAAAATNAQTPNLRRSTRENKGKNRYKQVPATLSSHRSAARPTTATAVATPIPMSSPNKTTKLRNTSISPSPLLSQDSNGTSTSAPMPATTKRKAEEDVQTVTVMSKKQRRPMSTKEFRTLFNPEQKPSSPVLATSPTEDKKNTSEAHAEDSDAVLVYEASSAQEKEEQANREPSGVAANKGLEGRSSDLHEMPEAILEGDELKIGSHQSDLVSEPCMRIQMCSLNKAAEIVSMLEAGEQDADDSIQNSLPELQNRACCTDHHEEASKAIEDVDSIGIQDPCTSSHSETIHCDETDYNDNMCVGCKIRETSDILKSCDGKGCKRRYHLSCMDPPLDVSLGIWLCIICTKKRLQFGVYSVSEGIESLWDVKEGVDNGKQYFVKYKNLAHVHNRWVSESDIVDSTPQGRDLISKFSKRIHKEKTIRWRQEWAEPHRLLKRRALMPPKEAESFFNSLGDKFVCCSVEWLVKWKDLGYEHATWELEASSFLCTPEAQELKRSYDNRVEAARKSSDPAKVDKVKEGVFQKLQRLPDGCPPGLDDNHLSSLNQLREFWHNSHGAVLIDDQERVIKTILFVMSILPHISQPLLIVSTSASLSLWETKFSRLAASINVVVYNGEKDVRKSIQNLEFYEDGSVMFQVLLTHPDAVFEDIEAIEQISWETVIVDDCQNSRVSKCLEQLKRLPTNFRMVLLSSSLKENIPEYINLLSFLNPEGNGILSVSNSISFDTAGTLAMLKKKLASYVAFERKGDSSKFSEYWVPAHLSTVQLELYCYTLLSNSPALRSHSKTDNVGALRNILVSLRKCCDHPYLVDQMLQSSLTKGHPVTDILDIGVRSCGKLLLLDKMLQKIRIEGLRVLILSQSGGGSGNPMGDILDDFIRQRFGYESYERVERGLLLQKKQTSMNMFNDKTKGRFIFLIDSRACGPSIKLSSVDAIIIYSSDWNPVNDLRALQRVTMESQSEHVPVFRLYSSCTVEEKALILAKHDHILDSNIQNITPSLSHSLLSWGASLLFNRLEECQNPSCSSKGTNDNELFMDNVALEFLTKLPKRVELSTEVENGAISKAYLRGSFYSRDIVVVGEREGISSIDGDLPKFWAYWLSLLNGRSPCWQHISEPAQRSRRKIQNMEGQSKNMEEQLKTSTEETDEARIKRRRIGEIIDSSPKSLPGKNKDTILPGNNTSSSSHQIALEDTWQELERNNLDVTQKGLHIQLKPELSKLYKLLQMPENVISLCEELLEYILKNHQISQEPKGILHAFNLAMCWRAASLLKHKVNHTESLTLATKNLNYECSEELAEYVYGKLKILKKKFAHRAGETSKQNHTASVCKISTCEQETSEKLGNVKSSQATLIENDSHQEDTIDIWTEETVSGESGLLSDPGTRRKECLSRDELLSRIMNKRIKLVDKAFFLRRKSIQVKHSNEVSSLDRHRQKEVAKLREVCSLVVEHLRRRQNHIDQEDRDGKIKRTVEWFTMLLYAFLQHMRCQHNRLEMRQSATWTKESQLKEETLQAAKSGHLDHTFDQRLPLPDSEFAMEEFSHFREVVGSCHVDAAALSPEPLDDNSAVEIASVRSVNALGVIEEEARNIPAEVPTQGPAPQTASLSVNVICSISDGSQGDAPLAVQSLEPSDGDHRSAEHVEEGTVGSPRQGDAAMEVSTGNRSTASANSPHLETPASSASREATFPVSREVEAQSNLVTQCAQHSLVSSQLLQGGPEQADLSGGASTQVLQSESQQTISVSSNLLERAQADESQPSHETDTPPCSVQSAELRSEGQPSIPVYNNLLERTQPDQSQPIHQTNAAPSSVQSAELQSEGQPSIPVYNNLLERTQPDQSQPIHQTNAAPDSMQSAELFPVASMMFNHPPIDAEPLKNELHKLRLHMDTLNKVHEMKKTQLRTECSIEMEKVKRKYDLLIEEQESTHLQQKKSFDGVYDKVLRNQSLAEDFRAKFISASAAQGVARVRTPPIRRTPQSSQQIPMRPSVVGSLASPSALPSAYRPPAPRPRVQAPQADQPSLSLSPLSHPSLSSSQVVQPSPLISSHLFRATSGTLSPIPPPRGNYGVQGESAPRAPAPHLQLRPPRAHSHSIPPGTSSALAASASPPDSHVPPLGTSAMSTLHSALPSPGSKIAARSSITAGMLPSDSTSLSLDAWLTASLGLSGDAPRATASVTDGPEVDVVCLSDDE